MDKNIKIVIFGTGAIGGSIGAWIAKYYKNIYFVARGKNAKILKEKGLTTYQADEPQVRENISINVINSIHEAKDADIIFIGVKNYDLEAVAKEISKVTGDNPIVVGLQNGLTNQSILPKYFSKVIYCIIGYNAWIDKPGVIGYQKKGPLIFGTNNDEFNEELKTIVEIFDLSVNVSITDHLQDAVHSKLIINLANSLTTLVGYNHTEMSQFKQKLFQKLFINQLLEGIKIVKAANFKEHRILGTPSWRALAILAKLPHFITGRGFQANMKKFPKNSMMQDILQRGGYASELESLNGYILNLAKKNCVKAPINQAIYEFCVESFSKSEFTPIDIVDVWEKVHKK